LRAAIVQKERPPTIQKDGNVEIWNTFVPHFTSVANGAAVQEYGVMGINFSALE
jgi:hypothetical protein